MKTIGLIGGTTWASTVDYYKIINQQMNQHLGSLNSAKVYLYSLNFEVFKQYLDTGQWDQIAQEFIDIAKKLEAGGADCILICANTPHLIADIVQQNIGIPLINIGEQTALAIRTREIKKIGLLGTRFTMEQDFFKEKLAQQKIETLIPDMQDREFIHHSIFNELGKGLFLEKTKYKYLGIIEKLIEQGAEGIVFGCTEIPLLIKKEDCSVPVFDTTIIHATSAVEFALG